MSHFFPKVILAACGLPGVVAAQSESSTAAPVVSKLTLHPSSPSTVSFIVSWPNSWRNERNHDAAWIVLRGPDAQKGPVLLADTGHSAGSAHGGAASLQVATDGTGVFVARGTAHRGDVAFEVTLRVRGRIPKGVKAWSVGMVYIPAGGFDLGDDDALGLQFGAFHGLAKKGDAAPTPEVFVVHDESEIEVAQTPGSLWYTTNPQQYRGDQAGPIPAAWPKGTQAFYVMKHELRQGAYAEFLSALPKAWQELRAPSNLPKEESESCTIVREGERFFATSPERPCNFVSWDDTCAYLDWLALRPMTEFEFEKAARGPRRPVAGDYPWGTADDKDLKRTVAKSRDLNHATVKAERELADANKAKHGASFYWVMDLAGSVWERCISAGHAEGRKFVGSHGDGVLSAAGAATNEDWPKTQGRDANGMGYRGGADYFVAKKADDPTNPNSPVAVRTYAGWGGAERYKTYSARGCRSVAIGRETLTAPIVEDLKEELRERVAKDQEVRGKFGLRMTDAERAAVVEEVRTIDRDNTVRMQELIHRYGWPTNTMLGERGTQDVFLMVQHADRAPAFQAMCLPLLEKAVADGEASASGFAYLTDRVRVKQKRPQLYGTQYLAAADKDGVHLKNEDGSTIYLTPIVEDPDSLDARRKAAGLSPWADYETRMASLHSREAATAPRAWDGKLPVHAERR